MPPSGSASRLKRPLAVIVGLPAVFGALAGLTSGVAAGMGLGLLFDHPSSALRRHFRKYGECRPAVT